MQNSVETLADAVDLVGYAARADAYDAPILLGAEVHAAVKPVRTSGMPYEPLAFKEPLFEADAEAVHLCANSRRQGIACRASCCSRRA